MSDQDGVDRRLGAPPRLERIVPFLTLTVFLDLVGYGIILPLLPSYIGELGGSAQVVGFLFASFATTQLASMPILGRISDRHGRRRVIAISLAANAVAMVLFSVAIQRHALWLLFASRILAGATSGNIGACQAAVADISEGPARVRAMGKMGAGIGLGVMLGPWIGGRASVLGDAAPPLVAAGMAVVALVGVLLFLPETNTRAVVTDRPQLSARALVTSPRIVLVMALYFFTFLYIATLQTALALLVAERFAWTKERVGDLFGLFGFVTLVMQFGVVGPISRRLAPPTVLFGAALVAGGGLTAIALSPSAPLAVGGLVVLACGVGLSHPQLVALASSSAGEGQQGTVLGFAQSSGALSRAIGPVVWGSLYHHLGPTAAFLGGGSAALVSAAVALRLWSASRLAPAARSDARD